MVKKILLLSVVLLFLANFVCADYSELVASVINYSGTHFYVDDRRFDLGVNLPQNKISLDIEGLGGIIIGNDTCSVIGNYSICLKNIVYGYHNYTTDTIQYKAILEVHEFIAYLTATKEITKTSLLIGDDTRVSTLIKNTGSVTASNVEFVDNFEDFEISEVMGCSLTGTGVRWDGYLHPGDSHMCSFTIKATKSTSLTSYGQVTYYNGRLLKVVSPNGVTVAVADYSLRVLSNISKNLIEIGDNSTLNITITNNHGTETLFVYEFSINVPFGLKILKKSSTLDIMNNKYIWLGSLPASESVNLYLILKGELAANYTINEYADYMVENLRYKSEVNENINVYLDEPKIVIQSAEELNPGEKTRIKVYVMNPSSKYIFKDLDVEFTSNVPGISASRKTIKELKKKSHETIYEGDFIAPEIEDETDYYLSVHIDYKSIYNQYMKLDKENHITIKQETTIPVVADNATVEMEEEEVEDTQQEEKDDEGIKEQTSVQEETPLLLSSKEELTEKVSKILDRFSISPLFILIDLITFGLIIFAFIKIK